VTQRTRRLLSLGLPVALVLALAFAVVATLVGGSGPSAASTQESVTRHQVQRVASSFAVNVNTYSSSDFQDYAGRVRPLLTPDFEKSFSRFIQGIVGQMRSIKIQSKGEVLVTGVSSIDQDSATVLVVSDADVTTSVGERARHFRWRVDLVRQQGRWLVNGFEPT